MLKAVIFDLDDTLYEEMEFVKGGFMAVAEHIESKNSLNKNIVYQKILEALKVYGRGNTFDIVLKDLDIFNEMYVFELVRIYRSHIPELTLAAGAEHLLLELKRKNFKLGMITDGDAGVQRNKVKALKIENFFDCLIFTDELGSNKQKPNRFPFQKALEELEVKPQETIYIGDNPEKDFVTAKKMWMNTIRIKKNMYSNLDIDSSHEAHYQIDSLTNTFNIIERIENSEQQHDKNQ